MFLSSRKIRNLQDVVDWRLCAGCGACAYVMPPRFVELVNIENEGIRPRFSGPDAPGIDDLSYCPGYAVRDTNSRPKVTEADHEFGVALEIWEGHAADPELRYRASSGGILSALALYCLERASMKFVVHTAMDEKRPWLNRTVKSCTRTEILDRSGSRYSPSSPCEGLKWIEESDGPCVFIGKPCDVAAISALRRQRPQLDRNLGLVLTFFCAGTPSTRGTLDLLKGLGAETSDVQSIRYRGNGWPGSFDVNCRNRSAVPAMPYLKSWGSLAAYRPLRCRLCPDGLGHLADISCGDAWEKYNGDGCPGTSIVLVRTDNGRGLLERAIRDGYLALDRAQAANVSLAQPSLLARKKQLFGRMAAFRLFAVPFPHYRGFSIFRSWLRSGPVTQLRSLLGTTRRVIARRWFRPRRPETPILLPEIESAIEHAPGPLA